MVSSLYPSTRLAQYWQSGYFKMWIGPAQSRAFGVASKILNACSSSDCVGPAGDDESDDSEPEANWSDDWDADCVWRPWAVQVDPIGES
jgi:hypothetical protein